MALEIIPVNELRFVSTGYGELQKSVPATASALHTDLPPDGVWRTVKGHHIYIVDGKIVAGAVPGMTKDFKKMTKKQVSEHQENLDAYGGGKAKAQPKEQKGVEYHHYDKKKEQHIPAMGAKKADMGKAGQGMHFFSHVLPNGYYAVSEASTGHTFLDDGPTELTAINEAKKKLQKYSDNFSPSELKQLFSHLHDKGQQSPGFTGFQHESEKGQEEAEPAANKIPFHTLNMDGKWEPQKNAVRVHLPDYPHVPLFMHKPSGALNYTVNEAKSGSKIGEGSTPAEAISAAGNLLDKYIDKLESAVKTKVDKYGLSPKYEPASDGSVYDHTKDMKVYKSGDKLNYKPSEGNTLGEQGSTDRIPDEHEYDEDEYDPGNDEYEDAETGEHYKVFHGTCVSSVKAIKKNGFRLSGLSTDFGPAAYFKAPVFDQHETADSRSTEHIVNRFASGAVIKAFIPKQHFLNCTNGRPEELQKLIDAGDISPMKAKSKRFTAAVAYMLDKDMSKLSYDEAVELYKSLPPEKQWGREHDNSDEDMDSIASVTTAYEVYCKKHGYKAIVDKLNHYEGEGWQIGVYDPSVIQIHDTGRSLASEKRGDRKRLRLEKSLNKKRKGKRPPYCLLKHEIGDDGLTMHVLAYDDSKEKSLVIDLRKSVSSEVRHNIGAEQQAIADYKRLLKLLEDNKELRDVIDEIMKDEQNHEHNLQCVQRYLEGDRRALSKLTKSLAQSVIELKVTDRAGALQKLLEYIQKLAGYGHSFSVVVDPDLREYRKVFGIDGDGADHIHDIKVKELQKSLSSAKALHSNLPDGGRWVTVMHHHIYVKDGKVLAGSVPMTGDKYRRASKSELAVHQAYTTPPNKDKIKQAMEKNPDGASITPKGNLMHKKAGYMVAMTDNEVTGKNIDAEIDRLKKFAHKHNLREYFFGYWKDAHTGKEFLDVSVHEKDRGKAVDMAKKYDQKAIWNIHDSKVEDTKDFDEASGTYKSLFKSIENYNRDTYNVDFSRYDPSEVFYIPLNRLKFPYQTELATDFDKVYENIENMKAGMHIDPVSIGYDYDVHDGHHRIDAAKVMQYSHVPCVVVGNDDMAVGRAKEAYASTWRSYIVTIGDHAECVNTPAQGSSYGQSAPAIGMLKSLGAAYDLEHNAWVVTVEFASEAFRKLADVAKTANVKLREL